MNADSMMKNLLELCETPSVSASIGERLMPGKICEMLLRIPYFNEHRKNVRAYSIEEDPQGGMIFALMRATRKTDKTIMLLSHFDVVGTDEYGAQKELAFMPKQYTEFLKTGAVMLPLEAKKDLDSGEFLFGRGVCDMKWGIAADIELLSYFGAHSEEQEANLLFVSVSDEERNSFGMLSAVPRILTLSAEQELHITSCVVCEPDISPQTDRPLHVMHVGAAGKIMPVFYCVGKETHVGQPFCGLNPDLLASAVVREAELSAAYIDTARGCYTPAPTCLKQSDLKSEYSVQTPCAAYAYFNVMTLTRTPEQILQEMERTANAAFVQVLTDLDRKHGQAEKTVGGTVQCEKFSPNVIRYTELYKICEKAHGERFTSHMKEFIRSSAQMDLRDMCIATAKEVHGFCPDRSPMIILFFAPPYYPHTGFPDENGEVLRACRMLAEKTRSTENFMIDFCFNGLTDMSYLSLRTDVNVECLTGSFPIWGERYSVPLKQIRKMDIPFVNFAPLGRDAHKFTERVDIPYSFGRAPTYLMELIKMLSERS